MSKTSSKITVRKSIAKNTKKPWLILDGRKIVGRSDQKGKAQRSAGYRQQAIDAKKSDPKGKVIKVL